LSVVFDCFQTQSNMTNKQQSIPKLNTVLHTGPIENPIVALEDIFHNGGVTLIQAAFKHSFFLSPELVRGKPPKFPNFARTSRTHYTNKKKGDSAVWKGSAVTLDDNSKAQSAWAQYSGRALSRKTGYGVRHIWGNPWNPDVYTAGWNLCYMPFWVGMLTESQHPHPALQKAIKQVAYELFFKGNPICNPPDFVTDPGFALELRKHLGAQPINILRRGNTTRTGAPTIRGGVLPITLIPPEPEFKQVILRTHKANICVTYEDGRSESRTWNISQITEHSNIIGNIRTRPEFRSKNWRDNGIKSVKVTAQPRYEK